MVRETEFVHHRGMEFIADLIVHHLASVASPGLFVGAAVVMLVLVSGLAARVIEIWEAMSPHDAERTASTAWPTAERLINDFSDDGQKAMQEISRRVSLRKGGPTSALTPRLGVNLGSYETTFEPELRLHPAVVCPRRHQRVATRHTPTSSGSERTPRVAPCRISKARLPSLRAGRAVSA